MPPADAPAELWVLVCGCERAVSIGWATEEDGVLAMGQRNPLGRPACGERPRLVRYERSAE